MRFGLSLARECSTLRLCLTRFATRTREERERERERKTAGCISAAEVENYRRSAIRTLRDIEISNIIISQLSIERVNRCFLYSPPFLSRLDSSRAEDPNFMKIRIRLELAAVSACSLRLCPASSQLRHNYRQKQQAGAAVM